jgi:hypothetical protein
MSCPHCHTSIPVPEEFRQASDAAQWTTLLVDTFTSNDNNWESGSQPSEYFTKLNRTVADARYRWQAQVARPNSISNSWLLGYPVEDFHLIVNCKHVAGTRAGSGWGVVFRILDNQNYYWFRITDRQFFSVSYIHQNTWQNLVEWTRADCIKPNGVNQLEVVALGTHFTFLINGQVVSEVEDNHFTRGLIGLAVEAYTPGQETTFDFMDLVLRAP